MSFERCNHAVVKIVSFCLLLSNEWFRFKIKSPVDTLTRCASLKSGTSIIIPIILGGITFIGVRTRCSVGKHLCGLLLGNQMI